MVPSVPITPTTPDRVVLAALRAPGRITPTTGTFSSSSRAGRATAEAVLQATTKSLIPRSTRKRALLSA